MIVMAAERPMATPPIVTESSRVKSSVKEASAHGFPIARSAIEAITLTQKSMAQKQLTHGRSSMKLLAKRSSVKAPSTDQNSAYFGSSGGISASSFSSIGSVML